MTKIKAAFFGSDQYSKIVLDKLKQTDWLTITDRDAPVGILASYGKIIPQKTLNQFPFGILNLHPSLLPQYRGPSPVQTALLEGKTKTGITIMKMDEQIDHGPIVWQKEITIKAAETAGQLYHRLFKLGATALIMLLPDYLNGKRKLKEQNHQKATYTEKLDRQSGFIPNRQLFSLPTATIRKLQAFSPWPGIWTEIMVKNQPKRLKILQAHLDNKQLILDEVQLEGKKKVSFKQLLEGYGPVF